MVVSFILSCISMVIGLIGYCIDTKSALGKVLLVLLGLSAAFAICTGTILLMR